MEKIASCIDGHSKDLISTERMNDFTLSDVHLDHVHFHVVQRIN